MSRNEKTCPRCGTTVGEFQQTGLLGCAECYRVFREEILPTVRYVQGRTLHTGKKPEERAGENYDLVFEQERLKEGIEDAMREGRYREAEEMKERLKAANRILRGEESE